MYFYLGATGMVGKNWNPQYWIGHPKKLKANEVTMYMHLPGKVCMMTALDYYLNLLSLQETWTVYHHELHTVMLNKVCLNSYGVNKKWTKKPLSQGLIVPNITITEWTHTMQSL